MDLLSSTKEKMPMIECDRHQGSYIQYINIDPEKGRTVFCPECNEETDIPGKYLIPLIRLFKSDQDNLIIKWPLFRNKDIVLKSSHYFNEEKIKMNIELIQNHFDNLKETMIKLIEETKKGIFTHINSVSEKSLMITHELKEVLAIKSLQNCFSQNHNDISKLDEALKSCINKTDSYLKQNEKEILKQLEEIESQQKQFEMDNMHKLSNELIEYVKKLQYITPNNYSSIQQDNLLSDVSIQVLKSSYASSENCTISKLQNNQIQIENDFVQSRWRQVYLNHILNPSDKYEITVQFLSQARQNDEIILGLIEANNLSTYGWMSELSLYTNDCSLGISKVIQGFHFSKMKARLDVITFQICIEQKILRCVGKIDGQQHIVELENKQNIKENQQYYFYISMWLQNSKVKINSFSKVSRFNNN